VLVIIRWGLHRRVLLVRCWVCSGIGRVWFRRVCGWVWVRLGWVQSRWVCCRVLVLVIVRRGWSGLVFCWVLGALHWSCVVCGHVVWVVRVLLGSVVCRVRMLGI